LLDAYYRSYDSSVIAPWTCPCGLTGNKGKFCTECGSPLVKSEEFREVKIERAVVTMEDMNSIRMWCDRHELAEKYQEYSEQKNSNIDYTVVLVEAVWANSFKIDTKMVFSNDDIDIVSLWFLFERMTKRLRDCFYTVPELEDPVAEGKIILLEYVHKPGGMAYSTGNRYCLYEADGNVLFNAQYYTGTPLKEVCMNRAVISRKDFDAFIGICGGASSLADQQKTNAVAASSVYIVPPWQKTSDKFYEIFSKSVSDGPPGYTTVRVKWENGAELFPKIPSGRESVLLKELHMLATKFEV